MFVLEAERKGMLQEVYLEREFPMLWAGIRQLLHLLLLVDLLR
jgi:hypothetical protein